MTDSQVEFFEILRYAKNQQKILLSIFKILHNICNEYNIPFMLCEGSLLGCIRHDGFIPWDDDIDIYMSLNSINKLQNINIPNTKIIKYEHSHYFYTDILSGYKIDIFVDGFRDYFYLSKKHQTKNFEEFQVAVPNKYQYILSCLYPEWEKICYVTNHRISKEKFNSSIGYDSSNKHQYMKIGIETAKEWINLYDKK